MWSSHFSLVLPHGVFIVLPELLFTAEASGHAEYRSLTGRTEQSGRKMELGEGVAYLPDRARSTL